MPNVPTRARCMSEVMMKAFETGQTFKVITLESGSQYVVGEGEFQADRIVCIMENGEMASVPWFIVTNKDGHEMKINGRYVESIS